MSKTVLTDAVLTVDGTDLSNHCSSVEIEISYDEVDLTGFGEDFREFGRGLGDGTFTCDFFQDFAASSVDAVLWPLAQSGGTFTIRAKADSGRTSDTNPEYSMVARIFSYSPIAGGVGDASTTSVTFRNAGTAGITRGTA